MIADALIAGVYLKFLRGPYTGAVRIKAKTSTTISTTPRAPEGPYPQLRLWGHEGKAPTRRRIRTMRRIVKMQSLLSDLPYKAERPQIVPAQIKLCWVAAPGPR